MTKKEFTKHLYNLYHDYTIYLIERENKKGIFFNDNDFTLDNFMKFLREKGGEICQ